ncbi:MAG: CopD family protein [Rhodococcus sp. (in: high G+C Gram-positive bacteria)]
MFGRWWALVAGVTAIAGVGVAWLLARPDGPDPSSVVRVVADCLGAAVFGLALLRTDLFPVRGRPAVWRTSAAVAGAWTVAEVGLVVAAATESSGSGIGGLPARRFTSFLTDITVGQLGLVTVLCTAGACLYALAAYRSKAPWSTVPLAVLAVLALVARPITGHMSQQLFGAVFVAVHTVAAALWLGVLAAMTLTLRAKGSWAMMLPAYSRLAWWSVWILAVSGTVNAAVKIGDVNGLWDTGYGRVVLAKTVALVVLVLLARRLRATWLVAAVAHRTRAEDSKVRAAVHVCVLTAAFGLAAALATTA